MTDILLGFVSEAERNVFPTLSRLSEDDVENIWTNVASFIERQMSVQKAVCISGLGTFTFSQQKLDVGHKYIFIQRPVFLLSEKLCQSYGLKQTKPCAIATDVPVVPLNFAALSVESPFERDMVEGCIRETLLLLLRAIAAQHAVQLTFRGIGVLFFRHGSVKMKFYRDFLTAMDDTGRLLWSMSNRPGTSVSIVSETSSCLQRPATSNVITLPTISFGKPHKEDKDQGVAIPTEHHSEQEDNRRNTCVVKTTHPARCLLTSQTNAGELETKGPAGTFDSRADSVCGLGFRLSLNLPPRARTKHPPELPESIRNIKELFTTPYGKLSGADSHSVMSDRKALEKPLSRGPGERLPSIHDHVGLVELNGFQCTRPCEPPQDADVQETAKGEDAGFSLSCTDYSQTGQELCRLCMQRAQRNVPLYLAEERERKEREQAKVLMLAEHQQVKQSLQREQVQKDQKREYNKKVAAFNLDTAQALNAKKTARPPHFEGSYILNGRPITPPRLLKQRRYMQDLMEMVDWRRQQDTQKRDRQELIDRLHQVQLTEEQTKLTAQELRQKQEMMKNLQKALDAQLEDRASPIPARQPDSEGAVFGARAGTPLMVVERRQRARKLHEENMCTATSRRKEEQFHYLSKQKKESDMLLQSNKEQIADRIARYKKLRKLQASLEDTWSRSVDMKRQRDLEEEVFIRSGARLLLDQCEQYRRCYQCKRKPSNGGETNIWKESRYIPGARLIL